VSSPDPSPHDPRARGLAAALAAYLIWGIAPVYFHALQRVPALEIVSHRVVWSVLVLAAALSLLRRWPTVRASLGSRRQLGALAVTTALISVNWGIFIWATNGGRLLEASLGYFINPLVNVALGALFLRERLSRRQLLAVGLAALGVAVLVARVGALPWVSLALAITFGLYALVRKVARIDALGGLFVETVLLAPLALGFLWWRDHAGVGAFGADARLSFLLSLAGVITATPLVLFAVGVTRLRLSTMGVVQYLAPTCQFLLAVLAFGEPFDGGRAGAFVLIWASLAIYTVDALAAANAASRAAAALRVEPGPGAALTGSARAPPGAR
jgi:chloramphenicol-sensitive protein RarD